MLKITKFLLLFMTLNIYCLALKIDSIDFDKKVKLGSEVTKEFTLQNSDNFYVKYSLEVEGKPENIKINPVNIVIPPFESRSFKISIIGDRLGENSYFLILSEDKMNLNDAKTELKLKMNYRIEQKYFGE